MKSYFAHIWKEDNKTYSVEFPDLPVCFSAGDTLDDAIKNASDALNAYLESFLATFRSAITTNFTLINSTTFFFTHNDAS